MSDAKKSKYIIFNQNCKEMNDDKLFEEAKNIVEPYFNIKRKEIIAVCNINDGDKIIEEFVKEREKITKVQQENLLLNTEFSTPNIINDLICLYKNRLISTLIFNSKSK